MENERILVVDAEGLFNEPSLLILISIVSFPPACHCRKAARIFDAFRRLQHRRYIRRFLLCRISDFGSHEPAPDNLLV